MFFKDSSWDFIRTTGFTGGKFRELLGYTLGVDEGIWRLTFIWNWSILTGEY
jgi:hypothetical protein